ncbi:hypothetical protein [Pseudoalteromonas luteoviolacea]|uniref:Uncharacterized protein n=1 Tax=Pseudoalteromonas luteoviolacea H33 TaxID=1365251 RepID=A0A167G708_9GAMM|nr:hypothetical protein [Pseudoalteromonas luteoviolacea]KZN54181.1 hypothetical protein N476_08275 [Pseudoalteromonas luteoviolacea H33]KZN78288.1 hypothetical protein N477_09250 [Pseudoalteromonas luteoviolacea H33-S]MBQ4877458.1 hypothetical protein [Pseudoalteromonas luteoviolacea]MBQ4906443.1 hypothetical protein [Pseudoalteromonas luteoviolacea]
MRYVKEGDTNYKKEGWLKNHPAKSQQINILNILKTTNPQNNNKTKQKKPANAGFSDKNISIRNLIYKAFI